MELTVCQNKVSATTFSHLFCFIPAIHVSKSSWSFGFRICFTILGLGSCKKEHDLNQNFLITILLIVTVCVNHLLLPLSQCLQQCLLQLFSALFFQFWPVVGLSASADHFHQITHKNPVFSVKTDIFKHPDFMSCSSVLYIIRLLPEIHFLLPLLSLEQPVVGSTVPHLLPALCKDSLGSIIKICCCMYKVMVLSIFQN